MKQPIAVRGRDIKEATDVILNLPRTACGPYSHELSVSILNCLFHFEVALIVIGQFVSRIDPRIYGERFNELVVRRLCSWSFRVIAAMERRWTPVYRGQVTLSPLWPLNHQKPSDLADEIEPQIYRTQLKNIMDWIYLGNSSHKEIVNTDVVALLKQSVFSCGLWLADIRWSLPSLATPLGLAAAPAPGATYLHLETEHSTWFQGVRRCLIQDTPQLRNLPRTQGWSVDPEVQ